MANTNPESHRDGNKADKPEMRMKLNAQIICNVNIFVCFWDNFIILTSHFMSDCPREHANRIHSMAEEQGSINSKHEFTKRTGRCQLIVVLK